MSVRHIILFLLVFTWVRTCVGQVKGIVVDAENGDTLSFAYILSLQTQKGCFSGLDGRFSMSGLPAGDSLRVSLLGYLPRTVAASGGNLTIALQPGGVNVQDVVIVPTENPALRIVRNVVEQRGENDPQNLSDYRCETYNKLSAGQMYAPAVPDSERMKHHIFLSETVTRRHQARPGKVREEIVSARLAGYPGKVIPFTAADLQDVSFYSNYVGVFGQPFLSPVSPPGLNQYRFTLMDTLLTGEDSIFTIDFQPSKQTFDGFAGTLRVVSGKWALLTVEADLVLGEPGLLIEKGRIRQVNRQLDSGEWVPAELNTEIDTKPFAGGVPIRFHFSGFSAFSQQAVGDSLPVKFRSEDVLVVAEGAGKEDSVLQEGRVTPLDSVDLLTYHRLDSIGKLFGLSKILDQSWKIADGKIMIGPVDLLLEHLYTNNRIEKTRLGLGLATNERLSKRFSLSGFGAWGFHDRRFKYAGSLQLTPLGDDRLYFGFTMGEDLVESGWRRLGTRPERGLHLNVYREFGIRNWYLKAMDYVTFREAWVGVRLPSDLGLRIAGRTEAVRPGYAYSYGDSVGFDFEEAEVALRWAPGAEYAKEGSRRLLLSNTAPVLMLRYTRGLTWNFGDFEYNALAFSIVHSFPAFRGGACKFQVNAGWNDRALPRARMRVYRSNFAKGNFSELPGAFNTMRYDEFAADMYAEAFLYVSPRLRWLHIGKRFQPRVHLSMTTAWGELYANSNTLHQPLPMVAPSLFYLEPGLTLTHLIPAPKLDNVFSSLIRSLGVGLYYRAGAYTFPEIKDNFAFRLSLGGGIL